MNGSLPHGRANGNASWHGPGFPGFFLLYGYPEIGDSDGFIVIVVDHKVCQ